MKNNRIFLSILGLLIPTVAFPANVFWDGNAGDNLWATGGNWAGGAAPLPADIAFIGGSGTTVNVNSYQAVSGLRMTTEAGEAVTVNIGPGGTILRGADNGRIVATGSSGTININGGTFTGEGRLFNGDSATADALVINLHEGILSGFSSARQGVTINMSGGVFDLGREESGRFNVRDDSSFNMTGGVLIFDVWGAGTGSGGTTRQSEFLDSTANAEVNLEGGSIQVRFDESYIPQVGDRFDILNGPGFGNVGDGSQVSNLSADGKWDIVWDISGWTNVQGAATGVLEIVQITAIPEPSLYAFTLGVGVLLLVVTRRRRN